MHNADRQRTSFDRLVSSGVYSTRSTHSDKARAFFAHVVGEHVLKPLASAAPLRAVDCGCGPGIWSEFLLDLGDDAGGRIELKAFDLSGGMVDLARQRLEGRARPEHVVVGDLLDPSVYRVLAPEPVDLLFAYDVVQQLPPKRQAEAIDLMLERLATGGRLVIFDHEKSSPYGRRMARRKFITRYLHIPLVPRYYCNASYPPLADIAAEIGQRGSFKATVLSTEDFPKRALVVERTS